MNPLTAMVMKEEGAKVGYVYVMEFKFQAKSGVKVLYKVGVTKNKPIDRMLQIAREFFMQRRYVPECRLVRFREVPEYDRLEKELHSLYEEYSYDFGKLRFGGCTEFFDIDVDVLLDGYDRLVPKLKDLRSRSKDA